jgi:hypothetical protein
LLTHLFDIFPSFYKNSQVIVESTRNTWTTATLSEARGYLAATSVDNRYALFGGGYNGSSPSDVVDMFDSKKVKDHPPKKMGRFRPTRKLSKIFVN